MTPTPPLMRVASREEYERFIRDYPRKLERDVFGAYEPPLITWNDFALGKSWPASVVAYESGESYKVIVTGP